MPGSKRIPNMDIDAKGTIAVELWCNRVDGQVVVAGNTITVMTGPPTERPCTPERAQGDAELLEALNAVTNWRRDGRYRSADRPEDAAVSGADELSRSYGARLAAGHSACRRAHYFACNRHDTRDNDLSWQEGLARRLHRAAEFQHGEIAMRRRDFTKLALASAAGTIAAPAVVRAQAHLQLEDDELLRPERRVLFDRPGQREGSHQPHRDDVRRPHQDPVLRRGRTHPGGRRLRRGVVRHGRDELRQLVFLDRQELRRAIFHGGAVRPQLPGLQRLVLRRRRRAGFGARSTTASISSRSSPATPACR